MPFASALLAHRRVFWIALALGLLRALTTLRIGFLLDDYAFVAWLDGTTPKKVTPFNLYEFATADRVDNFEMVRRGPWPWWTDMDLKVRFFRPLSSALLWLDHAVFGHAPLGYHLHSIAWYLVFLGGVGVLFRLVLSPRASALAFLLFAFAGAHAETVGWIAARHMLIGATPAIWGLVAHVHYRERGFSAGRWLPIVGIAVGLLGSETALGALLYWIAYEAFRAYRERSVSPWGLAIPCAIAAFYFAAYKIVGFGADHNDAYIEPLSAPGHFAKAALVRLPLLLGEMIGGTSAAFAVAFAMVPFFIAGVVSIVGFAAIVRAVWPRVDEADRRSLTWLGVGSVLATLIAVGGYPGARLLLLPAIAGYAFIATVILRVGEMLGAPSLSGGLRFGLRAGRAFLLFSHLVFSPFMFLAAVDMLGKMETSAPIDRTLDSVLGAPESLDGKPKHVFILTASDPVGGLYVGAARLLRAPKTVDAWVTLSMARATHHIERTGDRTLAVSAEPGLLHGSFEGVFRSADYPMHVGEEVRLDDIDVTVKGMDGHYPTAFEVAFRETSIDDPSIVLLAWREGQLVPVKLARGERIDVPWSPGPTGVF